MPRKLLVQEIWDGRLTRIFVREVVESMHLTGGMPTHPRNQRDARKLLEHYAVVQAA